MFHPVPGRPICSIHFKVEQWNSQVIIMIELEKYRGTKSRHICPGCGSKGVFARYIDNNGEYLSDDVGRCNRESKCGYHKKPKEHFIDRSKCSTFKSIERVVHTEHNRTGGTGWNTWNTWNRLEHQETPQEHFDTIPFESFKDTLEGYDKNSFVIFLNNLLPDSIEKIQNVLKMYFVGTFEDYTCFPSIDRSNKICRAKLIRFNPATGRRLKGGFDTSSLPAKLKLKDFNYKQIFFGEHLLSKYPDKPVAIVESEKSAIIASICFPEFIWLGCNSKQWLKAERLLHLGKRKIILYPDADGFAQWQKVAQEARSNGLLVRVSTLIENYATNEQKENGYDLADYLITEQQRINEYNSFVDQHNTKVDAIKADEVLTNEFDDLIRERRAVMMIDGNLTEDEANDYLFAPENIYQFILNNFKQEAVVV